MFMYRLAKDLGLTVEQVMEMSQAEFAGWAAFYKYEHEEHKKAMQKSRSR
jgi:hypothetical protein